MKKLFVMLLCLLMIVPSVSAQANDPNFINGVSSFELTDEDLAQIAKDDLNIRINFEKQYSENKFSKNEIVPYATGYKVNTYTPSLTQARNWWCGPAVTTMVIDKFYPGVVTQEELAAAWGITNSGSTNLYQIIDKLDEYIGDGLYNFTCVSTEQSLRTDIQYSINNGYPLIYSVELQELFYNEDYPDPAGHYIVGNAYYQPYVEGTQVNKVYYLEPYNGWKNYGYRSGEHEITISNLYTAIQNNPYGTTCHVRYVQ